jgi:hypothetical protein
MTLSSTKALCVALLVASGLVATQADDSHYVRSPKHSRRASHHNAGPSDLTKRGPTYSGRATYYAAGLGACGTYNSGSDFIVALNAAQYGNMGQRSSWCGKTIAITYNGNTQYATVQDACPSCPYGGLDMSEGLFKAFASTSVGVFQMSWTAADGSSDNNNNQNQWTSTSSRQRPTPTTTWQQPTWTWTPPTTTSSSSAQRSAQPSSSVASSSSSASQPAPTPEAANNLDSFALIYQGLNQMAVAAAS